MLGSVGNHGALGRVRGCRGSFLTRFLGIVVLSGLDPSTLSLRLSLAYALLWAGSWAAAAAAMSRAPVRSSEQ